MIDYVSAIHQRISRRSYLPAPIEEEKLAVLKEEIEKANGERPDHHPAGGRQRSV